MGGVALTKIENVLRALKTGWLKRYLDSNLKGKWKLFLKQTLKPFGDKLILKSNTTVCDIHFIIKDSDFPRDVIKTWKEIKTNKTIIINLVIHVVHKGSVMYGITRV